MIEKMTLAIMILSVEALMWVAIVLAMIYWLADERTHFRDEASFGLGICFASDETGNKHITIIQLGAHHFVAFHVFPAEPEPMHPNCDCMSVLDEDGTDEWGA